MEKVSDSKFAIFSPARRRKSKNCCPIAKGIWKVYRFFCVKICTQSLRLLQADLHTGWRRDSLRNVKNFPLAQSRRQFFQRNIGMSGEGWRGGGGGYVDLFENPNWSSGTFAYQQNENHQTFSGRERTKPRKGDGNSIIDRLNSWHIPKVQLTVLPFFVPFALTPAIATGMKESRAE